MPRQVRRILAPIDYSDGSKLGLEAAFGLAALLGAEIEVVHVWDRPEWVTDTMMVKWDGGTPRPLGALIHENEERQLRDFLASLAEIHSSRLKPRLLSGDAASAILKELDTGGYDLCVASTHGRSGFKHLLLGSVTENLVRLAKVPVLTVPPKQHAHRA
jgi:nucleotide-binding universal stress UspA family protein